MSDIELSDKCRCERIDKLEGRIAELIDTYCKICENKKLEEQLAQLQHSYKMLQAANMRFVKENKKFREVLEMYGNKCNWLSHWDDGNIIWAAGYYKSLGLNAYCFAQKALEGKE